MKKGVMWPAAQSQQRWRQRRRNGAADFFWLFSFLFWVCVKVCFADQKRLKDRWENIKLHLKVCENIKLKTEEAAADWQEMKVWMIFAYCHFNFTFYFTADEKFLTLPLTASCFRENVSRFQIKTGFNALKLFVSS